MTTWREIRDLRARPPGNAGSDDERLEAFGASLQQAEELAAAATDVGYATRPILLFYALCQGFRAVCAVRLEADWERSGHGLSFSSHAGSVIDSSIAPKPSKLDLYAGAMSSTGETPLPGRVSIGELLATLFEFRKFEIAGQRLHRPLILRLAHQDNELANSAAAAPGPAVMVLVEGLPAGLSREELQTALDAYPTLKGGEPAPYPSGTHVGPLTNEQDRGGVAFREPLLQSKLLPVFRFPFNGTTAGDYLERYEELAPSGVQEDPLTRVVQPGVGAGHWLLGPITPWWALLLGLSSLARYHPAQWRNALDIDRNPIAPGLERIIDKAETSIPFYVFHALTAEST
jgi:hypothetical protein